MILTQNCSILCAMKTFEMTPDLNIKDVPPGAVFLDIETTGLSAERSHLYLFGCLWQEDGSWRFKQWLLESPFEERRALSEISDHIGRFSLLIHFNGDRFDLPYLDIHAREREIDPPFLNLPSLDLYKQLRGCKNLFSMPGARQKDFENFLGCRRQDRYDGGQLISIYHEYCKSGDAKLLELLLLHNREDVLGMSALMDLLPYQRFNDPAAKLFDEPPVLINEEKALTSRDSSALLRFSLTHDYPYTVSSHTGGIYLTIEKSSLRILLPITNGELKHFFSPARDYFYLPSEDMAIHKSVASYVDPAYRQKATPETCYIKRAGTFVPILNEEYREVYRETPAGERFALLSHALLAETDLWNGIVHDIFDLIRRS